MTSNETRYRQGQEKLAEQLRYDSSKLPEFEQLLNQAEQSGDADWINAAQKNLQNCRDAVRRQRQMLRARQVVLCRLDRMRARRAN